MFEFFTENSHYKYRVCRIFINLSLILKDNIKLV